MGNGVASANYGAQVKSGATLGRLKKQSVRGSTGLATTIREAFCKSGNFYLRARMSPDFLGRGAKRGDR